MGIPKEPSQNYHAYNITVTSRKKGMNSTRKDEKYKVNRVVERGHNKPH